MPEVDVDCRLSVLIVSTQRSGSKLLCDLLAGTGLMGLPAEYLNPRGVSAFAECDPQPEYLVGPVDVQRSNRSVGASLGASGRVAWFESPRTPYRAGVDLDAYLSFLRRRALTPNGVFTLNAHIDHLAYLDGAGIEFRDLGFDKVIYLERADSVAQAVSLSMSAKYDYWISHVADPRPPDASVSRAEVLRALATLEGWKEYYERRVRPEVDITLTYESFRADYSLVAQIPVQLGLCPIAPAIRPPQLRRTGTPAADGNVEAIRNWLATLTRPTAPR